MDAEIEVRDKTAALADVSMDSDDDSSSEEMREIDENNMRVTLEEQHTNPHAYDVHIAAVELAMSSENVVYIDKACSKMSEEFPMISSYWLKYIHHIKKACEVYGNNTMYDINNLYLRGLDDYFSLDLQLDYLNWILSSNNTEKIRTAFENAIRREGLHPIDGSSIWYMYKQYETAVFTSLDADDQVPEKLERVVSVIKGYLMFPNNQLEETYSTFLQLCKECPNIDVAEVKKHYDTNFQLYSEVQHFEEQLKAANDDELKKLQIFYDYIGVAEVHPAMPSSFISSLYHRATTEFCLNCPLWISYCKYMMKLNDASKCTINVTNDAEISSTKSLSSSCGEPLNTIIRSLRNCPTSVDLLVLKLRAIENIENVSILDVTNEFEVALQNAESNTLLLWLSFLEILWRRTDTNNETQIDRLRKTFSLAIETLARTWGPEADSTYEINKFWARLEYTKLNNPRQGREIWNAILNSGINKTFPYLWIELAQMELSRGPVYSRRIYRRAASECLDIMLGEAWLAFERVHGSAEDVEHCINKCQLDSSNWNQTSQIETYVEEDTYENRKVRRQHHHRSADSNKDRNHENKKYTKQSVNKKVHNQKDDISASSSVPRSSNKRQADKNEQKRKQEPPQKKIKKDDVNNDLPSVADIKLVDNTSVDSSSSKRVVHDASKDVVTIFVSNLDYNITEDDIKTALNSKADLGIVEMRLVKAPSGKSKGYAYVQLKDADAVTLALMLDRTPLSGRPMFISRCHGEKDSRKHSFKYAEKLEENKIFIRGLPFELTESELKEMFGKYGELKDVRLVTYRNGKSKGLAYVEYTLASAASAAILQTDNMDVRGFKISVDLSAPPSRKTTKGDAPLDRSKLLGGAARDQSLHGNPKAKISFIPRSVQKSVLPKTNQDTESSEPIETTEVGVSKSNDDFRKMMLGGK